MTEPATGNPTAPGWAAIAHQLHTLAGDLGNSDHALSNNFGTHGFGDMFFDLLEDVNQLKRATLDMASQIERSLLTGDLLHRVGIGVDIGDITKWPADQEADVLAYAWALFRAQLDGTGDVPLRPAVLSTPAPRITPTTTDPGSLT